MNRYELSIHKKLIKSLTHEIPDLSVSEWAAAKRSLDSEVTPDPGPWRNDRAPYLTEIMDCLSVKSSVQDVAIMKGAQGGFTTGIIENFIGYCMDQAPAPMMFVSADQKLIKTGMEVKIDRMITSVEGLRDKLRPAVVKNHKKTTGDTVHRKDFPGGFLMAVSARSPGQLRSIAIKYLLLDEVDGFPQSVGEEGDPVALASQRTKSFARSRKRAYISTPLNLETSRINELYNDGDKRQYYVPCLRCGEMQVLHFFIDKKSGAGLHYECDSSGRLIEGSVYYQCCLCGGKILDAEKILFLQHGEWRPDPNHSPVHSQFRSYHWSSILSPWYPWPALVTTWLRSKGTVHGMKTFFNTELGLPWEERGVRVRADRVMANRRPYPQGTIPNKIAKASTGGPILLLLASCDTQDTGVYVEVTGYCKGGTSFAVEWKFIEGDTQKPEVWEKLRDFMLNTKYVSDDRQEYHIEFGVIDSGGHATEQVYAHCLSYGEPILMPIAGEQSITTRAGRQVAWREQKAKAKWPGLTVIDINTLQYKDELSHRLQLSWETGKTQPSGWRNFPEDFRDDYFKQFESEYRVVEKHPKTGRVYKSFWKNSGAANHAWDCEVYSLFALDIYAYAVCVSQFGLEGIDWEVFWAYASGAHTGGEPPFIG